MDVHCFKVSKDGCNHISGMEGVPPEVRDTLISFLHSLGFSIEPDTSVTGKDSDSSCKKDMQSAPMDHADAETESPSADVQPHDFDDSAPISDADKKYLDSLLTEVSDRLDHIRSGYHQAVRSRAWIHAMRDVPEGKSLDEVIKHHLSLSDIFNEMEHIDVDLTSLCDRISVFESIIDAVSGSMDMSDLKVRVDVLSAEISSLSACIRPIMALIHEKREWIFAPND